MEEAEPHLSLAPRRRMLATSAPLAAVLAGIAYLLRGIFTSGYTEGSDTLAHLFRIQQISTWIHHPSRLFDWTDLWYGGFHQFALYPYLTYIPPAVLDAVTGSPLASMKAVMFASVLAGAAGTYLVSLELTRDQPGMVARTFGAAGAAVAFALSPAFLGFMFGYGEYSDFVAIGFGPLLLLAFIYAVRFDSGPGWACYGVALALLLLMHPHVGICAALGHAVYLLFSPGASPRVFIGMVYAGLLAFLLSLYFWVPFLLLREAAGDPSLGTPFSNPVWAVEFRDYFDRDAALRYIGAVTAGLAVAGAMLRPNRSEGVPLSVMVLTGVVVALGGTVPVSANIPVLDMINPERALVMVVPGVALLAGFAIAAVYRAVLTALQPWQAAAVAAGLIGLIVVDTYFFNERTGRTVEFSQEFLAVTNYLESQEGTPFDRVLFVQADYNLAAYSPVLSFKSVTDGSQVQGAQTPPDVARLGTIPEDNAALAQTIALASRFNVRWIVIERAGDAANAYAGRLVAGGVATERFAQGRYVILERSWRPSLVRSAGPRVLEIGGGDAAGVVASLSSNVDIQVERGVSERLDDYSPDTLAPYGIVILAEPFVDDAGATAVTLAAYEVGGGRVVRPGDSIPGFPLDEVTFDEEARRVVATVSPGAGGEALISMGYSPFWSVEVDGQPVESRSDRGLTAVAMTPGRHEIVVSYHMPLLQRASQVGSIVAWLGVLGWLAWTLLVWIRRDRDGEESPD